MLADRVGFPSPEPSRPESNRPDPQGLTRPVSSPAKNSSSGSNVSEREMVCDDHGAKRPKKTQRSIVQDARFFLTFFSVLSVRCSLQTCCVCVRYGTDTGDIFFCYVGLGGGGIMP